MIMILLDNTNIAPTAQTNETLRSIGSTALRNQTSLTQLLRRPEISLDNLKLFAPAFEPVSMAVGLQVEVEIKYSGYVERQQEGVERFKKMENVRIPVDIDYTTISGLSREAREKLTKIQPRSLGQAARISGITPAAVSLISIYLKKRKVA